MFQGDLPDKIAPPKKIPKLKIEIDEIDETEIAPMPRAET